MKIERFLPCLAHAGGFEGQVLECLPGIDHRENLAVAVVDDHCGNAQKTTEHVGMETIGDHDAVTTEQSDATLKSLSCNSIVDEVLQSEHQVAVPWQLILKSAKPRTDFHRPRDVLVDPIGLLGIRIFELSGRQILFLVFSQQRDNGVSGSAMRSDWVEHKCKIRAEDASLSDKPL